MFFIRDFKIHLEDVFTKIDYGGFCGFGHDDQASTLLCLDLLPDLWYGGEIERTSL